MNTKKRKIPKICIKRALRTFLQTTFGYVVTNVTLYLGGMDFADKDVLTNALIGLAVAALSAGASAVMNIKEGDDKADE